VVAFGYAGDVSSGRRIITLRSAAARSRCCKYLGVEIPQEVQTRMYVEAGPKWTGAVLDKFRQRLAIVSARLGARRSRRWIAASSALPMRRRSPSTRRASWCGAVALHGKPTTQGGGGQAGVVRMSRNVSTRGARVAPAAAGEHGPEGASREPRYRDVSRWATREREGPDRT
jgi:hypothetical protein